MTPNSNTSNNSKTLKQSFFKEYFFYKLRSLKGFNITFLVINFAITVVFALAVLVLCIDFKNEALEFGSIHFIYSYFWEYLIVILFLTFIAENVLIMIMAAVNMKFCHNRSVMDTVGGLPLTVSQRFLGDFLSGLSSFAPTFFIGCIPAFIMMAVIQFGISPEYQASKYAQGSNRIYIAELFEDKFILIGFLVMLTMFLCLAASYTIACFVTSCSGKLNNSIIFTFGLTIALPIIAVYCGEYVIGCSIGVSDEAYVNVMGMLPPVGTIAHLFYSFKESLLGSYSFAAGSPRVIVMLAIVILPAVGAYLISKKRKAEKVDKPFIYKPLYAVATFVLTVTAFALVLNAFELPGFVIPVLIFTAAACIFIEYAGSHSKKTLWKGLVRFAVSAAVCALFAVIAYNTNGFNIGKRLPDEKKIRSVFINSSFLWDQGYNYETYDEPAIISAVLSEHKKIVDDLDEFSRVRTTLTWSIHEFSSLYIEYHMDDGSEIQRQYYSANNESKKLLDNFSNTLLEMPQIYNRTTLGILNLPCSSISYRDLEEDRDTTYVIKSSVQDEFIECLKNDLLNRPKDYEIADTRSPRIVYYYYTDTSGRTDDQSIVLYDIDKNSLAFLSNHDNFSTEVSVDVDDDTYYRVEYYADGITADAIEDLNYTLQITLNPNTPAKRELVSYFETEYTTSGDYSDKFRIFAGDQAVKVKKENEHAALTALIAAIKEQVSGGNIS